MSCRIIISAVVISCCISGQESQQPRNTSQLQRACSDAFKQQVGKALIQAIQTRDNERVRRMINGLPHDDCRSILFTYAQSAFIRAFQKGNIEAATYVAAKLPQDIGDAVQDAVFAHVIDNRRYDCLRLLSENIRRMNHYAIEHNKETPFDHIIHKKDKRALVIGMAAYFQEQKNIPAAVQYKTMISALKNSEALSNIMYEYCDDIVSIAVHNNAPTPLHYAIITKKNDMFKKLYRTTRCDNRAKALQQQARDHLWGDVLASPYDLAQMHSPELYVWLFDENSE